MNFAFLQDFPEGVLCGIPVVRLQSAVECRQRSVSTLLLREKAVIGTVLRSRSVFDQLRVFFSPARATAPAPIKSRL